MYIGALDPVSNKATWIVLYELKDDETDELIDLSSVDEITVQVRDSRKSMILSATLSGGSVEIVDTGVFKWTFTASQMSTLAASRTYEVGCTIKKEEETVQLLIGTLPVINGVVG